MRHILVIIFRLLMLAGPVSAIAATYDSAARTATYAITSEVLGEKREIIVRTPPGFDPAAKYPVVYVTDAERNFELVASYLDYMADNDVYPRLVVTGVTNVNRNRDYIPRADADFDDTGDADRFLAFVQHEWVPFITGRFPASANRVMLGHSFGGVFTLHTFFTEPELFDAYVALGSSAWIADRVLFEEAEAWFQAPRNADAFVYMAVGEGDGGPTVPSSQKLAVLFEAKAPESLEWIFDITPRTDHFKNTVSGMHDAFMALFPAWGFAEQLTALATSDGEVGVDRWFADKQSKLNYRFQPAWFDLSIAAMGMMSAGHAEAALATMRHLRTHHPQKPDLAAFSAAVFELNGQLTEAAGEFQRAINITREHDLHPNAIHLAGLQRGLDRVRAAQAERQDE
jgi:predicted alpha/beta superfamily hydrolase